jgi:hypothetical protein
LLADKLFKRPVAVYLISVINASLVNNEDLTLCPLWTLKFQYTLAALPPWLLFAGQFSHILPSCVFIFSLISNDFFFVIIVKNPAAETAGRLLFECLYSVSFP